MPKVFDGLVVGGKGVGKGVGFVVKGLFVICVGPVVFRRYAEEDHGTDGCAQVGASVAFGFHQVAGDFVKKEARGVGVSAEGFAFVVFDDADSGIGCAGAQRSLIFNR